MSPAPPTPLSTHTPTTVSDHPSREAKPGEVVHPHFSEVPSTSELDTHTPPNAEALTPELINVEADAPSETPSCLDRPRGSIAVTDHNICARTGARQPRAPIKPRVILSNKKPLYYLEGVTGYDSVQHRPPSGLYGGRVFSMRSHDSLRPISATTAQDAGAAKKQFNVSRERTKSSLGSCSSTGWEHSRSCDFPEAANVHVIFGVEPAVGCLASIARHTSVLHLTLHIVIRGCR